MTKKIFLLILIITTGLFFLTSCDKFNRNKNNSSYQRGYEEGYKAGHEAGYKDNEFGRCNKITSSNDPLGIRDKS